MTGMVILRPACVELGGDVVVGTLLSQIVHWSHPDAPMGVWRKGLAWLAKTREQWMAETGLTLKQYKRAIAVLKARGLVEVRPMVYRGLTQSHLRLLHPVAAFLEKTPGWSLWDHRDRSNTTDRYTEEVETSRRQKEERRKSDLADQDPPDRGSECAGEEGAGREGEVEGTGTVEAVVERPEAKVWAKVRGWFMKAEDAIKAHQSAISGNLGAYWKSRMALSTEAYQHPLTGKELGQLKQLSKYLGTETRPVIAYAIEHWWKFASRAGASAGTSFPADPDIGFLLKHHHVAVNLLQQKPSGKEPLPTAAAEPVQLIAQAVTVPEPVHVMTPQELADLLEGLKAP